MPKHSFDIVPASTADTLTSFGRPFRCSEGARDERLLQPARALEWASNAAVQTGFLFAGSHNCNKGNIW